MFRRILVSLVLALVIATPVFAVDLGLAIGGGQAGAQSQAGSQSQGGSVAAISGITGQASTAGANNGAFAAGGFTNNNQWAVSGTTGSTSQGGGAFALGGALSANQNQAVQVGQGEAVNQFAAIWLFAGP
jgi:hypothetical protein